MAEPAKVAITLAGSSTNEMPSNDELIVFKENVRNWQEIDEQIKKIHEVLRERKSAKNELTTSILDFMGKYNIEDLNTAAGKIRYKLAVVKEPLSQQNIKDRVKEFFNDTRNPEELNDRIFAERKTSTRPTLRRLPAPAATAPTTTTTTKKTK
jgi:hypothetical protein